jgi:tetratricopeptide (TPR) repeat protein
MKDHQAVNSEAIVEAHLKRAWEAANYEAARVELDAALAKLSNVDPQHRRHLEAIAWMNYATLAEYFGDLPTAAAYNERLLADDPNDLASHLALSMLSRRLGKSEDAARHLRRSGEVAEQSNNAAVVAMLAAVAICRPRSLLGPRGSKTRFDRFARC